MIVESIKAFLKEKGIQWTGLIYKNKKEQFVEAEDEDFSELKTKTLSIYFGQDGKCGMRAEIDLMTFKIYGEDLDCPLNAYAGENDKNVKLLEERDLSQEWIKFQLKTCGLVYAVMLRQKCKEQRRKIEEEKGRRVTQLTRKIEYLNGSIKKAEEEASGKIKTINKIENMADKFGSEQ